MIDVCAFSDGSSEGPRRSSRRYVLQRGGITFLRDKIIIQGSDVYDATIALRVALSMSNIMRRFFYCLITKPQLQLFKPENRHQMLD